MDATDNRKPFKVKDVTRNIMKEVEASTLEEIRSKIAEKFEKPDEEPTVHLDSDGTEIDDEEYFRTLDEETELIAVFPGEHWIENSTNDTTDAATAAAHAARLKKVLGKAIDNIYDVSALTDSDLEMITNMDPNSVVDITGVIDQLKEPGRPFYAATDAKNRIDLLRLLDQGAIFCSKSFPEEAELLSNEIRMHFQMKAKDIANTKNIKTATIETDKKPNTNEDQQQKLTTINEQKMDTTENESSLQNTSTSSNNNNDNTNSGSSNNNDI